MSSSTSKMRIAPVLRQYDPQLEWLLLTPLIWNLGYFCGVPRWPTRANRFAFALLRFANPFQRRRLRLNGMTASGRTSALPEATPEGALSAQLRRQAADSYVRNTSNQSSCLGLDLSVFERPWGLAGGRHAPTTGPHSLAARRPKKDQTRAGTHCQNCQNTRPPRHPSVAQLGTTGRGRGGAPKGAGRHARSRAEVRFGSKARRRGRRKRVPRPPGRRPPARFQIPEKCLPTRYLSIFTPNTPNRAFCGPESLGFAGLRRWRQQSQRTRNAPNTAAHDVSSFSPVLTANLKAIANGSFLQKAVSEDNLSLAEAATWRSSGEYL